MRIESSGSAKVYFPARSRDDIAEHLRERGRHLVDTLGVSRLVLFGSYARGDETAASDVDVLVIYEGEKRPDAYALVRETLGLPGMELHLYHAAAAAELADTIERMSRDGLEIY